MPEMAADLGLDALAREELVKRARELGARRPEVMTRVELRDEIVRLSESDPAVRRRSRGWLGVARDLVASVMDAGLNLPGAAAAIRGESRPAEETTGPPPVATLTLAEIYLAQGHADRALGVLEEVLVAEPEHAAATALRERVLRERERGGGRRPSPARPEEEAPVSPPPAPAPFVVPPPEPAVSEPPVAVAEPPVGFGSSQPPGTSPESFVEPAPEAMLPSVSAPFLRRDDERSAPLSPPFVPSDASPDAVRVPELVTAHEPSPPTLAAPTAASSAPDAVPAGPPGCALAQGSSAIAGYYALPAGASGGVLRVVWFVAGREGPTQGSIDLPLDGPRGRVTLPALEQSAHVRAALGAGMGSSFQPAIVAWVYRVNAGQVTLEFAPPGPEPAALRAQLGAGLADFAV